MAPCEPARAPHQVYRLSAEGKLLSSGGDAAGLALDWTSATRADGGHAVYMHGANPGLAHQRWTFGGAALSSAGLCLDWDSASGHAEMRPCGAA